MYVPRCDLSEPVMEKQDTLGNWTQVVSTPHFLHRCWTSTCLSLRAGLRCVCLREELWQPELETQAPGEHSPCKLFSLYTNHQEREPDKGGFSFSLFFYCCFKYSCLHSDPHSPPAQPFLLPTLDPTSIWFCPCVLYRCSWKSGKGGFNWDGSTEAWGVPPL